MVEMATELAEFLARKGHRARVISISHVVELQDILASLEQTGEISPDFYPELLGYFDFDYRTALPEARSIIIVATRQLPTQVFFGGQPVIIQPTYIYRDILKCQFDAASGFLREKGLRASTASLPKKTLAARSGLGRYGRNNVCYIPEMGSFHQLGAFYSDMPCETDDWGPPKLMQMCQTCTACLDNCPAGCITGGRFMVHAEKCLTRYNEKENAMPDWVDPTWHNSLIGCMLCQRVCPLDKAFMDDIADAPQEFSEAETGAILAGNPLASLAAETQNKLEALCLADNDVYPLLKRNLSLLQHKG